jgi:hypothetical protein
LSRRQLVSVLLKLYIYGYLNRVMNIVGIKPLIAAIAA